jgi:hypothetical protein
VCRSGCPLGRSGPSSVLQVDPRSNVNGHSGNVWKNAAIRTFFCQLAPRFAGWKANNALYTPMAQPGRNLRRSQITIPRSWHRHWGMVAGHAGVGCVAAYKVHGAGLASGPKSHNRIRTLQYLASSRPATHSLAAVH